MCKGYLMVKEKWRKKRMHLKEKTYLLYKNTQEICNIGLKSFWYLSNTQRYVLDKNTL